MADGDILVSDKSILETPIIPWQWQMTSVKTSKKQEEGMKWAARSHVHTM